MGGCTELGTSSTMVTGRQWLGTACLCGCMGQQGAAGSGFERWLQALDTMLVPAASRSHDHFGHENWDHQLKLAVAWNRVDMARSEIFTDERQWKVRLLGAALGRGAWRHPPTPAPGERCHGRPTGLRVGPAVSRVEAGGPGVCPSPPAGATPARPRAPGAQDAVTRRGPAPSPSPQSCTPSWRPPSSPTSPSS